jgi:hypothetical protein
MIFVKFDAWRPKYKTRARLNLTQNLSVKSTQIVVKFCREPVSRAVKIKISF